MSLKGLFYIFNDSSLKSVFLLIFLFNIHISLKSSCLQKNDLRFGFQKNRMHLKLLRHPLEIKKNVDYHKTK